MNILEFRGSHLMVFYFSFFCLILFFGTMPNAVSQERGVTFPEESLDIEVPLPNDPKMKIPDEDDDLVIIMFAYLRVPSERIKKIGDTLAALIDRRCALLGGTSAANPGSPPNSSFTDSTGPGRIGERVLDIDCNLFDGQEREIAELALTELNDRGSVHRREAEAFGATTRVH